MKFSGLKKGTVTAITINKADKAKYEAAVAKVKESCSVFLRLKLQRRSAMILDLTFLMGKSPFPLIQG